MFWIKLVPEVLCTVSNKQLTYSSIWRTTCIVNKTLRHFVQRDQQTRFIPKNGRFGDFRSSWGCGGFFGDFSKMFFSLDFIWIDKKTHLVQFFVQVFRTFLINEKKINTDKRRELWNLWIRNICIFNWWKI